MPTCTQCGQFIKDDASVCPSCGSAAERSSAPQGEISVATSFEERRIGGIAVRDVDGPELPPEQPREHLQPNPDPGASIRGITLLVFVLLLAVGIICLVAGWDGLETHQDYWSGQTTLVVTDAAARWLDVAWFALGCGCAMLLPLLSLAAWMTSRWRCRLARESLVDPLARREPTSFLSISSLPGWRCFFGFSILVCAVVSVIVFLISVCGSNPGSQLSDSNVYLAFFGIVQVFYNALWYCSLKAQENDVEEIRKLLNLRARGDLVEWKATQKNDVAEIRKLSNVRERGNLAEWKTLQIKNILDGMRPIPQKTYSIGKYPVTQAQWEAIMGENPSHFVGDDHPVEHVSWNDCQQFLNRLNSTAEVKKARLTFRLPTEAEWEHACRAGATREYCRLADGTEITVHTLARVAWYRYNSGEETHPVGQNQPNAFGLYDMLGNVWEWTSTKGGVLFRVRHGGSWDDQAESCESSFRSWFLPALRNDCLGFRLCASCRAD